MGCAIKLKNWYSSIPKSGKASFWFLICGILQKGINVITTPIFTRIMSPSDYGLYNVWNTWMGIVTIFATLNLSYGVFMRGLVKYENDRDLMTSSLQGLTTAVWFTFLFVYLVFYNFWNHLLQLSVFQMISMFICMLMTSTFSFWSSRQRVDFKYHKLVLLTLLYSIATPMFSIFIMLRSTDKVNARIFATTVVEIITFSGLYIYQFWKGKTFYNKKYWHYALKFNLPLIPHYLSQIVLSQSDRLMINAICGSDKAGIYSLAYSVSMVMIVVNTALLNTLNPWIYQKIKKQQYSDISHVSYLCLLLVASANIILIGFAPELVAIFAPQEYQEAIWVIPPVSSSVLFIFMYSIFADFEFYYEKTHFIMTASVIGAGLNVLLNYIFLPIFGYLAAGYTTLICYILFDIGHYFFMRVINKENMGGIKVYRGKLILAISLFFLTSNFILMSVYTHILMRYIFLILISLASIYLYNNKADDIKKLFGTNKLGVK